jgi:hypothetical protein
MKMASKEKRQLINIKVKKQQVRKDVALLQCVGLRLPDGDTSSFVCGIRESGPRVGDGVPGKGPGPMINPPRTRGKG